jgi:hypothetical protein
MYSTYIFINVKIFFSNFIGIPSQVEHQTIFRSQSRTLTWTRTRTWTRIWTPDTAWRSFFDYLFFKPADTFCRQYVLSSDMFLSPIRFVADMFCRQYVLSPICFVLDMFCSPYVLSLIRFVPIRFVHVPSITLMWVIVYRLSETVKTLLWAF